MTDPRRDDVVEQAFFGVQRDENRHTLIACSFEGPAVNRWRTRLSDHTRLQPHGTVEASPTALSYLTFENENDDKYVAIVRRVNTGHSAGRTNAHVLIGSAATLTVPLSLALDSWSDWLATPPHGMGMGTVSARYLTEVASRPNWPSLVSGVEDQLVEVLTRLLDNPDRPLSVIGCAANARLPIVWGLREAADGYLRQGGRSRRWSYSTYENRHDDGVRGLPEIVFLPELPGRGVANRTVVDLRQNPVDSPSRALAGKLLDTVLRGGSAPPFVSPHPHQQSPVLARQQQAVTTPQRVPPVAPVQAEQVPSDLGSVWAEKLLGAGSVDELRGYLAELAKLTAAERRQLRATLDVRALDKVADIIEVHATGELLSDLLHALYGQGMEDLPRAAEAKKHATELAGRVRSEHLAMMMAVSAWDKNPNDISLSIVKRWADGGRPPRPVKRRRPRRTLKQVPRTWVLYAGIAVAVLGLLGSGFAFGLTFGEPQSPQQPPITPGIATAPPPSPPQAAVQPAAGTANVGTKPLAADQLVYGFVRIKGEADLYPQMSCLAGNKDRTLWRCAGSPDPKAMKGDLVAAVVRHSDVVVLDGAARSHTFVQQDIDWSQPVNVTVQ